MLLEHHRNNLLFKIYQNIKQFFFFLLYQYFIILLFYSIFDQINTALVSIKASFKNVKINLTAPKHLNSSLCVYMILCFTKSQWYCVLSDISFRQQRCIELVSRQSYCYVLSTTCLVRSDTWVILLSLYAVD